MKPRSVLAAVTLAVAALGASACAPRSSGAPEMNAQRTCYGASWQGVAYQELAHTGYYDDFMERIFPRESGCDPCAYYPSQHDCAADWPYGRALGLPGLLDKDQMLADACKMAWTEAWHMASCQLRVVRWMVEGAQRAGRDPLAPWAATR